MTRRLLAAVAVVAALGSVSDDGRARTQNTAPALAATTFQLSNGLKVILHEDHSSPSVVVYVWYHVGSKDERRGRSGFAHLFEHLMFKGSKHVADGEFDKLLERAGGWNNGTTDTDRTNYFEQVPSNFLALALYLEADRMAGLWDAMSATKLDNQRAVVKNERRQSYEEQPYGRAELLIQRALWPKNHGYHHPTIGTMKDLDAAKLVDVERFYRTYYVPSNATLVIAGDIDVAATRKLVTRYFGWMSKRPTPPHVTLHGKVARRPARVDLVDYDEVQAAKVSLSWRTPTPFSSGDAELDVAAQLLAGGKSSRLYRRLVIDERLASSVSAYQSGAMLGGTFEITALAMSGADPARIRRIIEEEVARLAKSAPDASEVSRARKMIEAELLTELESLYARADRLAYYNAFAGTPDYLAVDLARYQKVAPPAVRASVAAWLRPNASVVMTVLPGKKKPRTRTGAP